MNNYEIMMNGHVQIGDSAPDFEALTTMGEIKLSNYKGKWLVLFSHPRRFYPGMYYWIYSIFKSIYIFWKIKYFTYRIKYW